MTDADRVASGPGPENAGKHRATYDWTSTEPSTGVVETVADATNREPLSLPQLYDSVDPDAIDSLFRSSNGEMFLSFTFAGCDVTVHSNGQVAVEPIDAERDSGQ